MACYPLSFVSSTLTKFNNATKNSKRTDSLAKNPVSFASVICTQTEKEKPNHVAVLPYIMQPYYHNSESFGSPDPWSRRCEHRPAGSGGRGSGQSELPTARSCAGRQSRPCAVATLSRSAAGDQTSGCSQMDSVINTNYQL